jgi:NAD(P)-dependent dehydrogenase (short-subunit alcohol dehydrogenase family)
MVAQLRQSIAGGKAGSTKAPILAYGGDMQDMNAVVTGGASGLGRAFCTELGARGCRVLVCDIDEAGAHATIEMVQAAGGEARYQHCDVGTNEEVEAVHEAAQAWFGHTDLLVNNAGVAVAGPMEEVRLEDWEWIMGINLWGVIYGCRAFLPEMKSRGAGHIINVASAAGLLSPPKMSPYNVTKSAVVSLTETIHQENRSTGVKSTVLCPTFFPTNIGKSARGGDEDQAATIQRFMDRSKLTANDVAASAISSVLRNELYAVPMGDGRIMWRMKRANPQGFAKLLGSKRLQKLLRL